MLSFRLLQGSCLVDKEIAQLAVQKRRCLTQGTENCMDLLLWQRCIWERVDRGQGMAEHSLGTLKGSHMPGASTWRVMDLGIWSQGSREKSPEGENGSEHSCWETWQATGRRQRGWKLCSQHLQYRQRGTLAWMGAMEASCGLCGRIDSGRGFCLLLSLLLPLPRSSHLP